MEAGCEFPESRLARLRDGCCKAACLAALYVLDIEQTGECNLVALFAEPPSWSERLDIELAAARALDVDAVEMIDLKRMPLVSRYGVVNQGDLIYVGRPDVLAQFIEETIARYSAFYPLLEALYWKGETNPLPSDKL